MEQQRLITTEKALSRNELIASNEKFIKIYCRNKKWDINNLTPSQILEITTNSEYKKIKK